MSAWRTVVRYHLVEWVTYVAAPWAVLAFCFAVNLAISAATHPDQNPTKAVASIYAVFFALGILSIGRSLPFALAIGLSRRSYYVGTALVAIGLAAVNGLALTLLLTVERATHGWGVNLGFFRVGYILAGPWYLTWLTSFVGLVLLFVYGMWFAIVYRRWDLVGVVAFLAAQGTVVLAGTLAATSAGSWHRVSHFFTALSAAGLTGVLAGLAVALLAGGYATIRRAAV